MANHLGEIFVNWLLYYYCAMFPWFAYWGTVYRYGTWLRFLSCI